MSTKYMNARIRMFWFLALFAGLSVAAMGQQTPKNVIIMIGDGMGYNQIQSANLYHHNAVAAQPYEHFPVALFMSTYPAKFGTTNDVKEWNTGYNAYKAWSDYTYVMSGYTDSAPAATAMATGKKTYSKSIGMDVHQEPLTNLTEYAKSLGKSAGVVTSVPLSHATPAGFSAHNVQRNNYAEIARGMLLDSRLDVIMGCGHPMFDNNGQPQHSDIEYKYVGGKTVWEDIRQGKTQYSEASNSGSKQVQDCNGDGTPDTWTFIEDRSAFQNLGTGKTPVRVLGIPKVHSTLQQARGSGEGKDDAYAVPFNKDVPILSEMALGALNVLDNNPEGFLLMIEGGAIDWACHANQPGRLIEEQQDFNLAVKAVTKWIESHGGWENTLLIVTADHETGYLTGPKEQDNSPRNNPLVAKGKNKMPGMRFNSTHHTNQLVAFFANGAGSDVFLRFADEHDWQRGYFMNNTEIAQAVFMLWRK